MPERDIIRMSIRELKRLKLEQETTAKHVTQKTAAKLMGLSQHHVRCLVKAVLKECFGKMVQMDDSHHDWLEGRGSDGLHR